MATITQYGVRYTGRRHGKLTTLVDTAHDPTDPEQAQRFLAHVQETQAAHGRIVDAEIVTRTVTTTEWVATYRVEAKRWSEGWELHVQGIGVTQAGQLDDAEAIVRDYIALDLGIPADSFSVEIAQA